MSAVEAFQLDFPALEEGEVRGAAGDKLTHQARDEHLASERVTGDARGVVHRRAEELFGLLDGVAGMDPDPDPDWWRRIANSRSIPT